MKKVLTVVIPTYNMEKYINNCLDSFIYDKETKDLEILIVNDGSKDKSLEIAKEYEIKYPNIFKVIDKENGGHGSTINAGLKVATGKYFKVVDADDWVITENFKELVEQLKDLDVDCICSNYTHVYEQSNKTEVVDMCSGKDSIVQKIQDLESFVFAMHSLTFKTEKIKEVRLTEHCFYVDVEYNLFSFAKCETLKYIPLNIYQYRLGRVGQSVSVNGIYKHRDNHTTVVKNILNFYLNNNGLVNTKKLIIFQYISDIVAVHYEYYYLMSFTDEEVLKEIREYDEWLKSYKDFYNKVSTNKFVSKLRNYDFKLSKTDKFIHKIKRMVKKFIGR